MESNSRPTQKDLNGKLFDSDINQNTRILDSSSSTTITFKTSRKPSTNKNCKKEVHCHDGQECKSNHGDYRKASEDNKYFLRWLIRGY